MKELWLILKKEFIHILRDKISLFLMLSMPLMLVFLLGFTISTEIRNAKITILDQAKDSRSQKIIEKIGSSGYFQIVGFANNEVDIDAYFKNKNVKLGIIIQPNFEEDLTKESQVTLQLISDVSDLNVASILNNYIRIIIQEYTMSATEKSPIDISVKMLYNPEMNSVFMFVPGIITLVMIILTALMSSITLSREKETGSMNMLMVTPVKKIYVVMGKIIPYMILSFISTLMILMLSVWVFKMPIEGSVVLLLLLCIIFMLTAASFGLMISAMVKTQLEAMMITMMGLFLPTVLLSGFLFPLDNMPWVFQILANIFPAKWFIIALKDVMIKGAGFYEIRLYLSILLGMAIILIAISLSRIDKRRKAST